MGSATIPDNMLEASVPAALIPLVKDLRDPLLREMVSDLASVRPFRRDIYRRGAGRLTPAETQDLLDRLSFVGLGQTAGAEIAFDCALGQISGKLEVYGPLLARLTEGPLPLREAMVMPCFRDGPLAEVVQAFALLASSGRAHPALSASPGGHAARRLNAALAGLNAAGIDRGFLAAPAIGSAIGTDPMEVMVVGELLAGTPAEPQVMTDRMTATLRRAGRSVMRDGVVIADAAAARTSLEATIRGVLAERLPLFRRLEILEA